MSIRASIWIFCLLPAIGLAGEVRMAVGETRESAVTAIERNGGKDITARLELISTNGRPLRTGVYWSFKDYDAVVRLDVKNGTVMQMLYWSAILSFFPKESPYPVFYERPDAQSGAKHNSETKASVNQRGQP